MTHMFEFVTKAKAPKVRAKHISPAAIDTFCDWSETELRKKMAGQAQYERISRSQSGLKSRLYEIMQDGRERTMADMAQALGVPPTSISGRVRELSKSGCLERAKVKDTLVWRLAGYTS